MGIVESRRFRKGFFPCGVALARIIRERLTSYRIDGFAHRVAWMFGQRRRIGRGRHACQNHEREYGQQDERGFHDATSLVRGGEKQQRPRRRETGEGAREWTSGEEAEA